MSVTLNDLPFIDLYVRLDQNDQAFFRSKDRTKGSASLFVPDEFKPVIEKFTAAINAHMQEHSDSAIEFDGVRCRLSRQQMSDDTVWACARRINTIIPDIDKLGMAPHIAQSIKGLGARDGLILVSGSTGAGKTTTAVALLAHYLRTYGGTAVTIEDPAEYAMKGRHGDNGQCFQIEVKNDEDWAVCLKRSLRWAPRYIYVGEIRTPKAAEQLLRAATTGHLVITTVHASTLEESIMGIKFLAEQAMGPGVEPILAAGITGVINQSLLDSGLWVKYLYTESASASDPIRALIRENKIGALATYVERTASKLANPNGQALPLSAITATKKP